MSDNHIEIDGTIIDNTKGIFRVELDTTNPDGTKTVVICSIAGRLRKNKINLLEGDYVKVKISPYDLTRGIIFFRHKSKK